jgi:hypothetical protein
MNEEKKVKASEANNIPFGLQIVSAFCAGSPSQFEVAAQRRRSHLRCASPANATEPGAQVSSERMYIPKNGNVHNPIRK